MCTERNYIPEDSETTIYILGNCSLLEIIDKVKEKWGNVNLDDVDIQPSYIHTRCLTYDLYDPSDYDNYIEVYYNQKGE
jgi:hypothetical protein